MTLQYLRYARVEIEGGPTYTYDAANPRPGPNGPCDGLRIRFETTQRDSSTPNTLNVLIQNAEPGRAQGAFVAYRNITLEAGYGDTRGLLFKGQIRQTRMLRENMTDTYLHILATDGSRPRNYAVINKTLSKGYTHLDVAKAAFEAMKKHGAKIGYVDEAALQRKQYPRGMPIFEHARTELRRICQYNKLRWSVQNGRLQIVDINKINPEFGTIILNSKTGLVGLPVQTIQGIEFTTLLNPRIVPTCAVKIDQASIQKAAINVSYTGEGSNALIPNTATDGIYKVYYVGHKGDTRGSEFYTHGIGIKFGDNISRSLAGRGVDSNYTSDGG